MNKNKLLIIGSVVAIIAMVGIIVLATTKKTITYNIIFETDGGSLIESQTVKKNEQVIKPVDPVKEGYTFLEWTYQGKTYDFSQVVKSDLKLDAKWVKLDENIETFVVKFDSDGGTTISNQVIEKGNKIEKPSDPVKEGYTFKGWILNNEAYDFEKTVEENIELKASWEKIEEVKNTNNNNNTNTNNNTNNNTNTNNNNTNSNTNTNNNTNNTNNNNNANNNNNTVTKYTVTFNSNGGSSVASQTVESGKTVSRPSNPSRSGYDFIGWQLNGNTFDFNNPINSNITLTAIWNNQIWEIDIPTRSIVKYKGNDSNVVIPSVIDGVSIVKINSNAFSSTTLKSVSIPASISQVEQSAFLKANNPNLTQVYMKDSLWKNNNWKSIFGTFGVSYTKGDSGTLIQAVHYYDGCNINVYDGYCLASQYVRVTNSDGIYPVWEDNISCLRAHGWTGLISISPAYYVSSDSYTVKSLNYSDFKGWIGSNGNTPQKTVVIPAGSSGEKRFTAVCEAD